MNFKLIFSLILVGLAVLFVIQNVAVVEIQFLLWSFSLSRAFLIFCVLAVGILVGWLMHSYAVHKEKRDATNFSLSDKMDHGPKR
jgi:uncharacterized integral membrane protein